MWTGLLYILMELQMPRDDLNSKVKATAIFLSFLLKAVLLVRSNKYEGKTDFDYIIILMANSDLI